MKIKSILLTIAIGVLLTPSVWGFGGVMMGMSGSSGIAPVDLSSDANLQAWYRFENNLTDTKNANNLTLAYGSVAYSTTTMVKNGTYSIGALTNYTCNIATTAQSSAFPGKAASTAVTVGGWVRTSNVDTAQMIGNSNDAAITHYPITIALNGSKRAYFRIEDSTGTLKTVTNNTNLANDTAYFIIGEWDGANCRIYVGTESANVAEDDNSTPTACANIYTITDGSWQMFGFGNNYHLLGYCDDFAIFNRTLTLAEKISWQNHGLNNSH